MTEETPPEVTPAPPVASPEVRQKTRLGDLLFGWKSAVVLFVGGLILGGFGGALIGWSSHDHRGNHHRERIMQMRNGGGPGAFGYRYEGGPYGQGFTAPGGGMPVPPNMMPPGAGVPQTAPSAAPTPKKS